MRVIAPTLFKVIRRTFLIIAFCWAVNAAWAQSKEKRVIVATVDRQSYFYIPASALADHVEGVLFQLKTGKKVHPDKRPIAFHWNSTCTDGYYNLTITPEQIFFSSSHDNPNPNLLFWVVDIDSVQYRQIKNGLQQKTPSGFDNLSVSAKQSSTVLYDKQFKDTFSIATAQTDTTMKQRDAYCQLQIKQQLDRYFSILNSYIVDRSRKVAIPSISMKPKYFSYSARDINGWFPVKFDPPKMSNN